MITIFINLLLFNKYIVLFYFCHVNLHIFSLLSIYFIYINIIELSSIFHFKGMQPTHSIADTHALVTAVGTGKGLRPGMPPCVPPGVVAPGMGPSRGPTPQMGSAAPTMPKAPSAIKTNIKAANQIHPYQR